MGPDRITFFVDDRPVKTVEQSPSYPMQLMLGINDFASERGPRSAYPKRFTIDSFRAYRPRA